MKGIAFLAAALMSISGVCAMLSDSVVLYYAYSGDKAARSDLSS